MKLISNEHRCTSLSIPAIEIEVNELRGVGSDPLDLLIALEEQDESLRDEFFEKLFPVGD